MIRHSFKMMWNQKKKYGLVLLELFIIFLVILLTSMYMIEYYERYTEGIGCETENVYYMKVSNTTGQEIPPHDHFQKVRKRLEDLKNVEGASVALHGPPYVRNFTNTLLKYGENKGTAQIRYADQHLYSVLKPELIRGDWYSDEYTGTGKVPVVIDKSLAKMLFSDEDPVGEIMVSADHHGVVKEKYVVAGVVGHYKNNDFRVSRPVFFIPFNHPGTPIYHTAEFIIRYKEGAFPQPAEYTQEIFSVLSKDEFNLSECSTLAQMKEEGNSNVSGDILFVALVVGFLLFNLMLGLIGVLGYNVNQRWSEVGIRRAVGATGKNIRRLIFFEMMALAMMAVIPAFLIAVQMPAFDLLPIEWPMFIKSMLFSLAFIFLMVTISVWYPGFMASKIPPAIALKEE